MKITCSVPILTLNVRHRLERLLPIINSVFDDVFIIDGNSTDGTAEYARTLGVRVERQTDNEEPNIRITDFTAARLRSWSYARHDWIFVIDADEVPSPELLEIIRSIIAENKTDTAHRFRRLVRLPDGRTITRAFFYPEYTMIRLFHRQSGITLEPRRKVHERFVTPPGVTIQRHEGSLMHAWPFPGRFRRKLDHYVSLEHQDIKSTWKSMLRWVIWYNLKSAAGQFMRTIWSSIAGALHGDVVLPWSYSWPMITYRFRVMREGIRAWQKVGVDGPQPTSL